MNSKFILLLKMASKWFLQGLAVQCLLCSVIIAGNVNGQIKSIHEVKVDLDMNGVSMELAFNQIEALTGYNFTYDRNEINVAQKLNIKSQNKSVAYVLMGISREANVKFRQINDNISVSRIVKPAQDDLHRISIDVQVSGKVISETGEPVIGANIRLKGSVNTGTVTDVQGNYSIQVPDDAVLIFSAIGYATVELPVNGRSTLNVTLKEDVTGLAEVVVIGSRNQNRTVLETPVPVDVIPLDEIIKDAPQIEITQILNYVAPSFSSNRQTISDGTDHVDPASLRGLGVDHVLVLINGKRRHSSSLVNVNGTFGRGSVGTDLNSLPAAAIKRIEVLRDGAAAQYGSDAIAGVINIVLKEDTDKINASLTTGQMYEGDGENLQFNTNYGFKVGDRGFINLTGQYQYRGRTDRAGAWTGSVFSTDGSGIYAEDFMEGDFSPFDVGKRLTAGQATTINAQNALTNNLTGPQEEALINANGGRRAFSMKVGNSESINTSFFLNSAFPVSDNQEFYLFGGINSRRGMASGFYRLPNQSRTLTTIYPNGFLPEINSRVFDGSISGGIRGEIGEWYTDFSNTYGTNAFDFGITNTHNASRGTGSPTSFNAGGFKFQQNTTNLDFSRYFEDALAGVNVAFGAEYRIETYQITAGEEGSYRDYGVVNLVDTINGMPFVNDQVSENIFYGRPGGSQVFPGFQPVNEVKESRGNVSVYTDFELNFTERFFVDIAARFEDYTDFGSTINGKVSFRGEVTDNVAIRGAASTGFRAPSLHQRFFNNTSTLFTLQNGVNVPNEVGTFRNDSRVAQLFGIPSLDNETSVNLSLGLTATINNQLDLTIDGYLVQVDDRVILTGQFTADDSEEIAQILASVNAGRAQLFVNSVDTETKGLDVILTYNTQLGDGSFKATLASNFNETTVDKINIPQTLQADPVAFFNREERSRLETTNPKSKINLNLSYRIGKFNATLNNVRFGEVVALTDDMDSDGKFIDQTFGAKIITDLSLGYKLTESLNLTIGASNLFDIYPDENRDEFRSGERFIYSRRVSQFGFNGGFYFARLGVTL